MSLSAAPTFDLLRRDFVCGWRDITGEPWSGVSGRYTQDEGAVWTTNGAGPHNIQMFVLAPDGTVLHCLPGYWESHDLAAELVFAQKLGAVWRDPTLSRAQKDAKFRAMNLEHFAAHPRETVARSEMQGFDKKFEARRASVSDCVLGPDPVQPRRFKTTDQIVHERMAARPFVPYAEFDVARFTDYGRQKYDKKQALLADVLPKAGPGGLREKLAGLMRQPPGAARKGVLRSLLDATLRRRDDPSSSPPAACAPSAGEKIL